MKKINFKLREMDLFFDEEFELIDANYNYGGFFCFKFSLKNTELDFYVEGLSEAKEEIKKNLIDYIIKNENVNDYSEWYGEDWKKKLLKSRTVFEIYYAPVDCSYDDSNFILSIAFQIPGKLEYVDNKLCIDWEYDDVFENFFEDEDGTIFYIDIVSNEIQKKEEYPNKANFVSAEEKLMKMINSFYLQKYNKSCYEELFEDEYIDFDFEKEKVLQQKSKLKRLSRQALDDFRIKKIKELLS